MKAVPSLLISIQLSLTRSMLLVYASGKRFAHFLVKIYDFMYYGRGALYVRVHWMPLNRL